MFPEIVGDEVAEMWIGTLLELKKWLPVIVAADVPSQRTWIRFDSKVEFEIVGDALFAQSALRNYDSCHHMIGQVQIDVDTIRLQCHNIHANLGEDQKKKKARKPENLPKEFANPLRSLNSRNLQDKFNMILTNVMSGGLLVDVTTEYQDFQTTFTATTSDATARYTINAAASDVTVYVDNIGLYEGAACGAP